MNARGEHSPSQKKKKQKTKKTISTLDITYAYFYEGSYDH